MGYIDAIDRECDRHESHKIMRGLVHLGNLDDAVEILDQMIHRHEADVKALCALR